MKITRIDNRRAMDEEVQTIQLKIGERLFTFTEEFAKLRVHCHSDFLHVQPCCSNEILIEAVENY